MKWNEYARIGTALKKAFQKQKYENATVCDFVFEILDRLKIEDGYHLVAIEEGTGFEGEWHLHAVPEEILKTFLKEPPTFHLYFNENLWKHIYIEESEMGAWQACILDLSMVLMPLYGHSNYYARKLIFSTKELLSIKASHSYPDGKSFNNRDFVNDERLQPTVVKDGQKVIMTHCYWSDWRGLVKWTDYTHFNGRGNMIYDNQERDEKGNTSQEEVLFEYNCGILF